MPELGKDELREVIVSRFSALNPIIEKIIRYKLGWNRMYVRFNSLKLVDLDYLVEICHVTFIVYLICKLNDEINF